jgi:hypothetical protein
MTTLRQDRMADVSSRLADAERDAGERHVGFAAVIGHSLQRLRSRLEHVHERCDSVDDRDWAGYVSDLDRGLDELDLEIARAVERQGPGPTVEDVLTARTSALEIRAWRVRMAALRFSPVELARARVLVATGDTELGRYQATRSTGGEMSPDALEQSMEDLRRGVGQAEASA